MTIEISGLSSSWKPPGFFAETRYGASPLNLASIPLVLGLFGLMATGTATPNHDLVDISTETEADAAFGSRSELAADMCRSALRTARGYRLVAVPVAGAEGAAAATATITVTGTSSSAGTIEVSVAGRRISVLIPTSTTNANQAILIRDAINNALPALPVLATVSSGEVTLTDQSPGARGNQRIIYIDDSQKPGTSTYVLAGGTAATSTTSVRGVYMTGGSGIETLTTIHALTFDMQFDRVVAAQNDATSAAAWEAHVVAKAAALEGRLEHVILGSNDGQSTAISLASTTLNQQRAQLVWMANSESVPAVMASCMGALRASVEQTKPRGHYDGVVLTEVAKQRFVNDIASKATQHTLLSSGVTPLHTESDGTVTIVRAITTHCLDGSTPDYRTLDTSEAVVPDYIRRDIEILFADVLDKNDAVGPDPANADDEEPGILTPTRWNGYVMGRLLTHQANHLITQVEDHPPQSEYDYAGNFIRSAIPVVVQPNLHSIAVRIDQMNLAA